MTDSSFQTKASVYFPADKQSNQCVYSTFVNSKPVMESDGGRNFDNYGRVVVDSESDDLSVEPLTLCHQECNKGLWNREEVLSTALRAKYVPDCNTVIKSAAMKYACSQTGHNLSECKAALVPMDDAPLRIVRKEDLVGAQFSVAPGPDRMILDGNTIVPLPSVVVDHVPYEEMEDSAELDQELQYRDLVCNLPGFPTPVVITLCEEALMHTARRVLASILRRRPTEITLRSRSARIINLMSSVEDFPADDQVYVSLPIVGGARKKANEVIVNVNEGRRSSARRSRPRPRPRKPKTTAPRTSIRAGVQSVARKAGSFVGMHPDVARFMVAGCDAFNQQAQGVYIPNQARPSLRQKVQSTYTKAMGANDALFFMLIPNACNDQGSLFVWYIPAAVISTASFLYQTGAYPAGYSFSRLLLPSLFPSTSSGLSCRVAAMGLKFTVSGTVTNQGGVLYTLVDTSNAGAHLPANNFATWQLNAAQANIASNLGYVQTSMSLKNEASFTVVPAVDDPSFNNQDGNTAKIELDGYTFASGNKATQSIGTGAVPAQVYSVPAAALIGWFQPPASTVVTMQVVGHVEWAGPQVMSLQQPVSNHPMDTQTVHGAIVRGSETHYSKANNKESSHKFDAVTETLKHAAKKDGAPIVGSAIADLTGSPQLGGLAANLMKSLL